MDHEKTKRGLEALAGDVPPSPAKASSPPPHSLSINNNAYKFVTNLTSWAPLNLEE